MAAAGRVADAGAVARPGGGGRERARGGLRILWAAWPDYRSGGAHGGNLRLFNYARELAAAGHEVYLLVRKREAEDGAERTKCLEGLKAEGSVADYFEVEYGRPRLRGMLSSLLFLVNPALANLLLRSSQAPVKRAFGEIVAGRRIDVCVFTARDLLFALPEAGKGAGAVVDWVDSFFLYRLRELRLHFQERRPARALGSLRPLAEAFAEERYYGRRADFNLAVSPVDKKYLDGVNGRPGRNRVLLNGVEAPGRERGAKVRGRIIFSGIMSFPPNYKSALWFIDEVFPLLRRARPDIKLVIAGADPVEELRARAGGGVEVTGYVEDMRREIARSELYVAPLVCGGGFKNKVVEAISAGTYVAATGMAVEFLGPEARRRLLVADSPREMADAILSYLEDPRRYAGDLEALMRIVAEELSWPGAAERLAGICREAAARAGG